jgi:TolB protein
VSGPARSARPVRPVRSTRAAARALGIALVAAGAGVRPAGAQDTTTIDRGVRIGIIYRPGVRPGMVVLPPGAAIADSVRAMLARDLDYSDRFELITLPGGDSIRLATPAATSPASARAGSKGKSGAAAAAAAVAGLNYPLYQALGADFAVALAPAPPDTTVVTVHDVTAGGVRRELRARLLALKDPGFRLAVHRVADRVLEAALGAGGTAATRVLFVRDGKVYSVDQDGADQQLVSSSEHDALSPAWAPDGRHYGYMEFWQGRGRLFVQDLASGKRTAVATLGQALDFTPAFAPDGKTLAFSRATDQGTDIYAVNYKDNCCLQRLTVGRFSDNLSPVYSPDGQRLAFVSTRAGVPQIYVMAADGTDQQLFAPFDYGVTGGSYAPDWSPDGQSVAFHREVGGTYQVFVLDVRTRAVRQLTSVGRNEDPTWAPDSRHMAFVSDRSGLRQLWIVDVETGRIRVLVPQGGARLPAWSPRLPETTASTP